MSGGARDSKEVTDVLSSGSTLLMEESGVVHPAPILRGSDLPASTPFHGSIRYPVPPRFSGLPNSKPTARQFALHLNYYLTYHSDPPLSDAKKLNLAAGLLDDNALEWFESQRIKLPSFKAFLEALQAQFAPFPHVLLAREALEDLRFTTDVATLESSFRHLLTSCGDMSEQEMALSFVRKLPRELQIAVKRQIVGHTLRFNDVVAKARFEETVLQLAKVSLASATATSSSSSSSNRHQPVCFHCGEPGHIRRHCPSKKSASAAKH